MEPKVPEPKIEAPHALDDERKKVYFSNKTSDNNALHGSFFAKDPIQWVSVGSVGPRKCVWA